MISSTFFGCATTRYPRNRVDTRTQKSFSPQISSTENERGKSFFVDLRQINKGFAQSAKNWGAFPKTLRKRLQFKCFLHVAGGGCGKCKMTHLFPVIMYRFAFSAVESRCIRSIAPMHFPKSLMFLIGNRMFLVLFLMFLYVYAFFLNVFVCIFFVVPPGPKRHVSLLEKPAPLAL